MKIGDYIRSKHYGIFKVLDIFYENGKTKILVGKGHTVTMYSDEVIIEDPEVINLIEDGDYVNGFKVLEILSHSPQLIFVTYKYNGHHYTKILDNEDIKSIVTKEQFESMEYRIGEENEKDIINN